ncbi:unnamed protein product [Polarella glacialis]|uniref:Uncharacterized protein n=1 Tax=Polarella glacialis TaxID=89957 RepID=A0A813JEW4_POLGL|nr:unnamed protein product [Polarella glacialis]
MCPNNKQTKTSNNKKKQQQQPLPYKVGRVRVRGDEVRRLEPTRAYQAQADQERVFRDWKRFATSSKASDIGLSVQFLDIQVSQQLRRNLAHWHSWASKDAGRRERRLFRTCLRRIALRRWHGISFAEAQRREFADQASALLRFRLLRQALHRWAAPDSTQGQAGARTELAARLLKQRTSNAKRDALQKLLLLVRTARKRSFATDVALGHAEGRLQALSLGGWVKWCRARLRRRAMLRAHVTNRAEPRSVRQFFRLWGANVRRETRHRTLLQRACVIMALSLKGRTFHGWLSCVQSSGKAVRVLTGLSLSSAKAFQSKLLQHWRAAAQRLRCERKALLRVETLLRSFFCATGLDRLRSHAVGCGVAVQRQASAMSLRSRLLLGNGMLLWRAAAKAEVRERAQTLRAGGHSQRQLLRDYLLRWKAEVAAARLEKNRSKLASFQRVSSLSRLAWSRWAAAAKDKRSVRGATESKCQGITALAQRARQRRGLHAWLKACVLREHLGRGGLRLLARAFRAMLAWRGQLRVQRAHVSQVQAQQAQRRQLEGLRSWSSLHSALTHCKSWEQLGLVRKVFRSWQQSVFQITV